MSKADSVPEGKTEAVRVEQRTDRRYNKEFGVRLYWLGDSADLRDIPGVVKDISAGGFGIEVDHPFLVGQLVSVGTSEGSLQCVVCHVRRRQNEIYRLGMKILSASDGSNHKRSLENLDIAVAGEQTEKN